MKVAFIGLGIMGSRMARHILTAGFDLTVWNRSPAASEPLQQAGATVATSATAAVREADLVLTMLSTPRVVDEVVVDGGVLDAMPAHAIWADSTTVSPAFALRSAGEASRRGLRFLSVPVGGTREPAEAGTLAIFVGGPTGTLELARPVLNTYSSVILHLGEAYDRGAAYKILINGMLAESMLVFSEAVRLGVAMGLDRDFLLQALPKAPVIAPFVASKVARMQGEDYTDTSFPLELLHKDVNLLVETAYATGQPLPLAALAREIYGRAKQSGRGREDFSVVHAVG